MPLARVVAFEGVDKNRIEELKREMQDGDPPEGFPPPRCSCCTTPRTMSRSSF